MIELSIILPVYNGDKYISQCINSILNTNYVEELEIIIVNDGSTDKTKDICEKYSKRYNNIKLLNNKNNGVSYSRNYGMSKANGKYIMFVDADDYLDNDWYLTVRKEIKSNNDILFFNKNLNKNSTYENVILHIFGIDLPCIAGPVSKLFKNEFLKRSNIKFQKEIMNGEDLAFNFEAFIKCTSYSIVNFSFYNYRIYVGSSTKRFNNKIFESDKLFHKYIQYLLNTSKLSKKMQNKIKNYCIYNGVYTIFNRLSFDKYYKNKKFYKFIYDEPYNIVLVRKDKTNKYNFKVNIVMKLIRYRLNYIIWLLLVVNRKINSIRKQDKYIKI